MKTEDESFQAIYTSCRAAIKQRNVKEARKQLENLVSFYQRRQGINDNELLNRWIAAINECQDAINDFAGPRRI